MVLFDLDSCKLRLARGISLLDKTGVASDVKWILAIQAQRFSVISFADGAGSNRPDRTMGAPNTRKGWRTLMVRSQTIRSRKRFRSSSPEHTEDDCQPSWDCRLEMGQRRALRNSMPNDGPDGNSMPFVFDLRTGRP